MAYNLSFFGWAVSLVSLLPVVGCWGTSDSINGYVLANEKWVLLYQNLEDSLLNSPEMLDILREKFFPSQSEYQTPARIDGVQVHTISTCIIFSNMSGAPSQGNKHNSSLSKCWDFRWTNSRLLNLIPADQLSALDPLWTKMLYSAIVGSQHSYVDSPLELNVGISAHNKTLHEEDYVVTLAVLLSWVSTNSNKN